MTDNALNYDLYGVMALLAGMNPGLAGIPGILETQESPRHARARRRRADRERRRKESEAALQEKYQAQRRIMLQRAASKRWGQAAARALQNNQELPPSPENVPSWMLPPFEALSPRKTGTSKTSSSGGRRRPTPLELTIKALNLRESMTSPGNPSSYLPMNPPGYSPPVRYPEGPPAIPPVPPPQEPVPPPETPSGFPGTRKRGRKRWVWYDEY